jgi:hypothetical protein
MKGFIVNLLFLILISAGAAAQKRTPLPHGMVFGSAPTTVSLIPAAKLDSFMSNRTRISAAIVGRVIKVTQPKNGRFTLDAGKGKIITARFKNAGVNLPVELKGKEVVISGVATRQFNAFDAQREAGSRLPSKNSSSAKQPISFEVVGLMVNR